ncbi:MAG: NAD-dependent deacylase [Deltaproteobacteria bacterium]|nr:NAD-dependent deacylase [Deltaproteobacteria bacterium]
MQELAEQAADLIIGSRVTVALTGAGISVESGIPDFRSAGGLWSRYDPAEYATISAFRANPQKVWNMLLEMDEIVGQAKPNNAHFALGELEMLGLLDCIITQNVDNLHQAGGSKNVIEYHGNSSTLSCLWCGKRYTAEEKRGERPPRCACQKVLKPDVIFFGEAIPEEAMRRSFELASSAQALLVVGTSAVVSPVNTIPSIAKRNGAKIVEVNKERTHLTDTLTDIFFQGSAGEIMPAIVAAAKKKKEAITAS